MDTGRYTELKSILEERRREIVGEVQARMKNVRTEGAGGIMHTVEMGDASEADVQDDIEFALIQMKAETLQKIDEALVRLEEGDLRLLLRVRRGDLAAAAAGAALRARAARTARKRASRPRSASAVLSQRRGSASLFVDLSS